MKQDLAHAEKALPSLQKEIETVLRPSLDALRAELHKSEDAQQLLEASLNNQLSEARENKEAEQERLEKALAHALKEQREQKEQLAGRAKELQSEFEVS